MEYCCVPLRLPLPSFTGLSAGENIKSASFGFIGTGDYSKK
jgi:hypothetical protein